MMPIRQTMLALSALLFLGCSHLDTATEGAHARIEYIAHASFRIVDRDGTSVVIDPYNSRVWLGYSYPKNLDADAVLVTHPHFDHDADYYFDPRTPIFRDAGLFSAGKIIVRGISTEHADADEIKARGGSAKNIAWVINVSGTKIVHLGDTRPLTNSELQRIGPVDVLISNLITHEELARMKAALGASTIIPMHYRLPSIAPDGGNGMKTVAEWLADDTVLTRLPSSSINLVELTAGIVVLQPRQGLEPWSTSTAVASEKIKIAREAIQSSPAALDEADRQLQSALALDAGNFSIYSRLAYIHRARGEVDKANEILEIGLIQSTDLDRSQAYRSRARLAANYEKLGAQGKARTHYEWIAKQPSEYGRQAHQEATAFLADAVDP